MVSLHDSGCPVHISNAQKQGAIKFYRRLYLCQSSATCTFLDIGRIFWTQYSFRATPNEEYRTRDKRQPTTYQYRFANPITGSQICHSFAEAALIQAMKCGFLSGSLFAMLVRAQMSVNFGPGYDFKVAPGNEIVRAETTYTPGAMEKNIKGLLFLWPGLWVPENRTTGDLIQTVIEGTGYGKSCRRKRGPVVYLTVRDSIFSIANITDYFIPDT